MRLVPLLLCLVGCIDNSIKEVPDAVVDGYRDLDVAPASINFGERTSSAPVTETVTLTSVGDEPVTISAIDVIGSGAFTLTWAEMETVLEPAATLQVVVTYVPASAADVADLRVTSNAVDPVSIVPLEGGGLFPEITVDPGSLSFTSDFGESVEGQVLVTSTGTSDLSISDMVVTGGQFSAVGDIPIVLAPGESTWLTATYDPDLPGETVEGKIWLTTNTAAGFAVVPLEGHEGPECIGLGEAWDRGLLDSYTVRDGSLRLENLSADDELCVDAWYVYVSETSQDMGAGDMDADFGGDATFPYGSQTVPVEDTLEFRSARTSGPAWWCMELYQYTQTNQPYDFTGARVPEPMLSYMHAGDQDGSWEWQENNPVMITGRNTNYVEVATGGGPATVSLHIFNMGSLAGTAEVWETIPADYAASGFSPAPIREEAGADGATVYVFSVSLDEREARGEYEQVLYDSRDITYTLTVPPCEGRQYMPTTQSRWSDSRGTTRTSTSNPMVVNCL